MGKESYECSRRFPTNERSRSESTCVARRCCQALVPKKRLHVTQYFNAFGYGMGVVLRVAVNRLHLDYQGLYPALTLGLGLLTYSVTDSLVGNGFLAVYMAGLVMRSRNFIHKQSLVRFHDGLGWMMQIAMFLTLGLQVFPSRLMEVAGSGLAIAAFLMCVARPGAVMATLLPTALTLRERMLVGWVGLRGAAPIVLATFRSSRASRMRSLFSISSSLSS
jgi:NhaP-type Na+/H+ and K+/H+ antiporter